MRQRLHQQRRQCDPAQPSKREHGVQEAAGGELGAEGGEVGPGVCGDCGACEEEEPEEGEDEEFLPGFGEEAVFALGVDYVEPARGGGS